MTARLDYRCSMGCSTGITDHRVSIVEVQRRRHRLHFHPTTGAPNCRTILTRWQVRQRGSWLSGRQPSSAEAVLHPGQWCATCSTTRTRDLPMPITVVLQCTTYPGRNGQHPALLPWGGWSQNGAKRAISTKSHCNSRVTACNNLKLHCGSQRPDPVLLMLCTLHLWLCHRLGQHLCPPPRHSHRRSRLGCRS